MRSIPVAAAATVLMVLMEPTGHTVPVVMAPVVTVLEAMAPVLAREAEQGVVLVVGREAARELVLAADRVVVPVAALGVADLVLVHAFIDGMVLRGLKTQTTASRNRV